MLLEIHKDLEYKLLTEDHMLDLLLSKIISNVQDFRISFYLEKTKSRRRQLVRADKLSLLRVWIVARHGSLRSILTFLGVGIVLKRFAGADKLPLLRVWIVLRHGSLRSILTFLGVGIVLKRFARADKLPLLRVWIILRCGSFRRVLVSIGVRIILRLLRRR